MKKSRIKSIFFFLFFLSLLPLSGSLFGTDRIFDTIEVMNSPISLTEYLDILEDKTGTILFSDILNPEMNARFKSNHRKAEEFNFGFTKSAYWLRLSLTNSGNIAVEKFIEIGDPRISSIMFYSEIANGKFISIETGNALPFSSRPYANRFFVFPLTVPANTNQTLYFRVQSIPSLAVPARIWNPKTYHIKERNDYLAQAIYFGLALGMAIFNLLLFFAIRDKIYLFYVNYITCMTITIAAQSGLAKEFLWPNTTHWSNIAGNVGFNLTFGFAFLFMRQMLNTKNLIPRMDIVIRIFTLIAFSFPIFIFYDFRLFQMPIQLFSFSSLLLIFAISFHFCYKKNRGAYLFFGAFFILLLGGILTQLRNFGILPSNVFTANGVQIGSALEMLLLAFALADRFNAIRREKDIAQKLTLDAERKLVESLKTNAQALEERVEQRTHALSVANSALDEANHIANAANHAKTRFLATMSHEIRTPMNGILGMAQLLLSSEQNEAERHDYVKTILTSGKSLLLLLNDILDLSKVEAGKLELNESPFFPESLSKDVLTLLRETGEKKGLTISSKWKSKIGNLSFEQEYLGDSLRLRQMLTNLISNAIKFTDFGSVLIEGEEISRDQNEAILRFTVTDTGVGFSKNSKEHLFQVFSQVDNSTTRRFAGSGLGLSIVRLLAEQMGGEVGAESEFGKGSIFWFTAKLGLVSKQSLKSTEISPELNKEILLTSSTRKLHILIVDDNLVNIKILGLFLKKLGHTFHSVENGALALEQITSGIKYDLILMDRQMPVMDGLEATRLIRQWESNRSVHIPIVAVTGDAFKEDIELCLSLGMDGFLAKPIDLEDLRLVIEKWSKVDSN